MISFRQTCVIFLGCFFAALFVLGLLTLQGCAASPGVAGGIIGATLDSVPGFVDNLVGRGVITPAEGTAWHDFMSSAIAAIHSGQDALKSVHEQAVAAQQAAGTAQVTAGVVGGAALASDQVHKVLAIRGAKKG